MSIAPADDSAHKPLDGGWGWMVVLGAHIAIGFAYATPKTFSIFFPEIQEELGSSYSEVAWIPSIMLATMYAGGPVSSLLVKRYGSRPIVILAGWMCGVSMVIASFADAIVYLYICIGIIGGCGLSLNLNASLTIISKYFLVRRPLANGLAMTGSPLFLCVLAPVNQYLLDTYGWRSSLLILGALMLNCCVAGVLMRPVAQHSKPPSRPPQDKVEEQPNDLNTKLKGGCMKSVEQFLDCSVFKERAFVIYLIGCMMFIFGGYGPFMFLPAYAVSQGVDEYAAASLLSITGFVDMFVRPGTGLLASNKWIRPRIQYLFGLSIAFNGICHLVCPVLKSFPLLVLYSILLGTSFGMVFALIFECLMDLVGNDRFPRVVGLVTIVQCFPMLLGTPAAGLLVDLGDYSYLFLMCGSVIFVAGLFLLFMNVYNDYKLRKGSTAKDTEQDPKSAEGQEHVEMRQTPEAPAVERTEPEATQQSGARVDPSPESADIKKAVIVGDSNQL